METPSSIICLERDTVKLVHFDLRFFSISDSDTSESDTQVSTTGTATVTATVSDWHLSVTGHCHAGSDGDATPRAPGRVTSTDSGAPADSARTAAAVTAARVTVIVAGAERYRRRHAVRAKSSPDTYPTKGIRRMMSLREPIQVCILTY
jgi:hypothetical protein